MNKEMIKRILILMRAVNNNLDMDDREKKGYLQALNDILEIPES